MSGTMMDNKMMDDKPLLPSAESGPTVPMDNAKADESSASPASALSPPAPSPPPSLSLSLSGSPATTDARRESPLLAVFIGPRGLYPGTRWLIYLAMAFVFFQVESWLLWSVRSHVSVFVWRMMIEGGMMLAAIFPGFVMARIEDRPFGDFGLPARRAFGRSFWVGTLWGIASLSVLMLALRFAGAFEFGSLSLHGARIWEFAGYYAVFFLLTGFFEEFLLRGYSLWVLAQGMNFLFMSHPGADGRPVVGRWLPHGVGLGRELSLLRSRQRDAFVRASAELHLAWSRLAYRRLGWTRGKLSRLCRDRCALGPV